tara:strand:+ start:2000 stop:3409 length:1410 start_codon:yes stop_codon:yes gene_type:complete
MKNIVICLPSDHYKKYFDNNAFLNLEKKYKVTYLLNKYKYKVSPPKNKKIIYYKTSKFSDVQYMSFIHLSMIKNKNKSKTFNYQFRRWYPNLYDFFQKSRQENWETKKYKNKLYFFLVTFLKYFYLPFLRRLKIKFLSLPFIYNFYKKKIIDRYPIDIELFKILQKINPSLIIYPSHCFEPETIKLVKISKKIGSKILFIIDNWDNLSSKTVFLEKPDAVTVWGKQSMKHAINVQNITKKNIFYLGSPKFDQYFLDRKKKFKNIFNFRYVLFIGVLQPFNEIEPLRAIDEEISLNKQLYKGLKLVYRPHPGREYLINKASKEKFKNIIFDPRMHKFIKTRDKKFLLPKKNYYESLISNSLFMVGGLSTVVLEALIFNKRYHFFSYPEKFNLTDPEKLYNNAAHYNEINKISYLSQCKNLKNLGKEFRELYKKKITKNYDIINELSYFYNHNDLNYRIKILEITNKILNN